MDVAHADTNNRIDINLHGTLGTGEAVLKPDGKYYGRNEYVHEDIYIYI